jgi:hypothetical protein
VVGSPAGTPTRRAQLLRELQALALAVGDGVAGLAEEEVAEADVDHRGQGLPDWLLGEELGRGNSRHREHLGDVVLAQPHLRHRVDVAGPLARLAGRGDLVEEGEVGVDHAESVAGGAGALGVGGEQRRLHTVGLHDHLADLVHHPRVRRRHPLRVDVRYVDSILP